jgi:integrase/recombinase XerD
MEMGNPKSVKLFGRSGRTFRIYFNTQRGYWYVAYNNGQQRVRRALFVKTRPEAEARVKELDAPQHHEKVQSVRQTWSEFQKKYLEFKTSQGKASKTISRYKVAMEAFERHLTKVNVVYADQVTLSVLEGFNAYRTKVEKADVKTSFTDAKIVKNAFKWANKPGRAMLNHNPALDWETPQPVKPKRKCYTADEVAALEAGARDWLRPVVTVLAWSGMRIGELINLRWSDIDFENKLINIRVQEEWRPKGRRDRAVPMHPKVETVLKTLRVGKLVFSGNRGGKLYETWCLHSLKKDQERLGLAIGDLHGFRRFFATTMMKAGVDTNTVREWGGWRSLETMLRYLADGSPAESVQAMQQAAQRLAAS